MAIKSKLTGVGTAPAAALNTVGTVATGLTAAGNAQNTALVLGTDDYNIFTTVTSSNNGAQLNNTLSAGDEQWVVNYDASGADALLVYPPSGGKINNGSLNASVSIAATKSASFICIDGLNFIAGLSA